MATFGYSALAVRETPAAGYPKPPLLDRVLKAIRTRHYSRRTEKTYVAWIKRYIFFHGKRHPAEMGAAEVTRFLTSLATDAKVRPVRGPQPGRTTWWVRDRPPCYTASVRSLSRRTPEARMIAKRSCCR